MLVFRTILNERNAALRGLDLVFGHDLSWQVLKCLSAPKKEVDISELAVLATAGARVQLFEFPSERDALKIHFMNTLPLSHHSWTSQSLVSSVDWSANSNAEKESPGYLNVPPTTT